MQAASNRKRELFLFIALSVIPILLYALVLVTEIPYSFSQIFYSYSIALFLLILMLYYLCFRLPGRLGWLSGSALTMLLFALTLAYKWTSGYSDNGVIAGLLPYKMGKMYYSGAQLIMSGLTLPQYSGATWRPLFPGLFSVLLLFTQQNLQWALAILIGLTGFSCYLCARQVSSDLGAPAAAVFMTLLYFYIQPLIGYVQTEAPGLMFGCLGFILLWKAAQAANIRNLIFGLATLTVAVSVRAGAFFILPMLMLWAGWSFRGRKRFSFRVAGIAALTVLATFLLINMVYPRLVGTPENSTFGNFVYTLYGQVRGGTGWNQARQDLNTLDPAIVYQATAQFFLAHPASLLIAIVKSYRDFFLPNGLGIFFISPQGLSRLDILIWAAWLLLLAWGLIRLARRISSPLSSLLVSGFIGIFLSIPFLPPIDGGARLYASTMPFFFALPSVAISKLLYRGEKGADGIGSLPMRAIGAASIGLAILMVVAPILIHAAGGAVASVAPVCPGEHSPFAIEVHPGSYVDLVPDGAAPCGLAPEICWSDFLANGTEKTIDDFYQELVVQAEPLKTVTRIVLANDLLAGQPYYVIGTPDQLKVGSSGRMVAGCAFEIRTTHQSIYKVETVVDAPNLPASGAP